MRNSLNCRILYATWVLAACGAAENPDAGPRGADAARLEIEQRRIAYQEAILRGDGPAMRDFWTADALILEPGMRVTGPELAPFLDQFVATARVTALEVRPAEVFVHGNAAYELGAYDETVEVQGQPAPMVIANHYFARWVKGSDGLWRFARFVAGPRDAPSPATATSPSSAPSVPAQSRAPAPETPRSPPPLPRD